MNDDKPKNNLPYLDALHGVQAGVVMRLVKNPSSGTPKHLRVGLDSAFINDAALARLLVKKGLITEEEYAEEVRLEANRELDRSEDELSQLYGAKITLR